MLEILIFFINRITYWIISYTTAILLRSHFISMVLCILLHHYLVLLNVATIFAFKILN